MKENENNKNISDEFVLLTQAEAAKMTKLSKDWYYDNRKSQDPIPYIKVGRRIYYNLATLKKWFKKREKN